MRLIDAGEQFARIRDQFPDFYAEHETEAWHRLIGLRNIIAHGYNEVDTDIIWNILSERLGDLADQIQQLVDEPSPMVTQDEPRPPSVEG